MTAPHCCSTHSCNQGRECPLRQPRDFTRNQRIGWWIAAAVWAMIVVAVLTGCERQEVEEARAARPQPENPVNHGGIILYRDGETGCEYLLFGRGGYGKAVQPRIAADGKTHMGCKGGA
jgi:hypothetical protein